MKKVININFQGRVIPIEETAYDILKQYVDSLRIFFANEEGKDEIINDIEGRIAELFDESLKKGITCITDVEVNNIIASMGRPEDFEADEANVKSALGAQTAGEEQRTYTTASATATGSKRLYRDENNKVLGGVCSGVANYFGIDPVILRILAVLFIGITFIPYLILWIAVPGSSSVVIGSQRKRLFRDTDSKMIAGVCSGLAQYFSVQVWVPRVLFLIPFFSFVFRWGHWGWWDFPHFLSFSFSPGAIVVYIILWIVIPEARSAADKLEMKGEKVDLNNIKSTIQGDLEGFKERAQQFGSEVKMKAQEFGENVGRAGKEFGANMSRAGKEFGTRTAETASDLGSDIGTAAREYGTATRRSGGGLGRVLVLLVKIFVYFVVGCILFGIVAALFGVGVAFTGLLPAYSYVLDDGFQKVLSWATLVLFIWVPVIAIVTWIIRRITGKRGNSNIIRLTFLSLWILGVICFVNLIVSLKNDFRYRNYPVEQTVALTNPAVGKLEIKTAAFGRYYNGSWFRMEPFAAVDEDTVFVKNIRLRIIKSPNDSFHVTTVKMANGKSKSEAEQIVSKMTYSIAQTDTVLLLDKGIAITKQDKFRNQQVIITVAVPVGKRIFVNDNVGWGEDVRIDLGRNDYWDWEDNTESQALHYSTGVEYVMTIGGLERVNKEPSDNEDDEEVAPTPAPAPKSKEDARQKIDSQIQQLEQQRRNLEKQDTTYRYKSVAENNKAAADDEPSSKRKTTINISSDFNISPLTSVMRFID